MSTHLSSTLQQLSLYLSASPDEFQRHALVYSIQDCFSNVNKKSDLTPEVLRILETLASIGQHDSVFYYDKGSELLECCLKVMLLAGFYGPSPVRKFYSELSSHSNAREMLVEWNSYAYYVLSQTEIEEPFSKFLAEVMDEAENEYEVLDNVKLSICYFPADILKRLKEKDFLMNVKSLLTYTMKIIQKDIESCDVILGSEVIINILESLNCRKKLCVRGDIKYVFLTFMLDLLGCYTYSERYSANRKLVIHTLIQIYSTPYEIILTWYLYKDDEGNQLPSKGIFAILHDLFSSKSEISLPSVLSHRSYIRLLIPLSIQMLQTYPSTSLKILSYYLSHQDTPFSSISCPFKLLNLTTSASISYFHTILDFIGGTSDLNLRKESLRCFDLMLSKYNEFHRYYILKRCIMEYEWDTAVGLLIDRFCKEVLRAKPNSLFSSYKKHKEIMIWGFIQRPYLEKLHTYQATASLYRVMLIRHANSPYYDKCKSFTFKLVEPLYSELSKLYEIKKDSEQLGLVIMSLMHFITD